MNDTHQPQFVAPAALEGTYHDGRKPKSLSFGEALQFTPLATSMLPAHDRIPIPQICRPRESAKLATTNERKAMHQTLMNFPTGKVKDRLKSLLKSDTLTPIKFKQSPTDHSDQSQSLPDRKSEFTLSSTAKTVLEMSTMEYRYGYQPRSVNKPLAAPRRESFHPSPVGPKVETPSAEHGWHAHSIPSPTKSSAHNKSSDPRLIVVDLPAQPAMIRPTEYVKSTKIDRKDISNSEQSAPLAVHIRSQRDTSDAALLNFQNGLMEIFEAQDQLDAGSTNVQETGFFESLEDTEETEPTLSIKTLERLQVSLKKMVGLRRLSDISAEHLRRLQRLCEPPIDRAQTLNLRLSADPSADEEDEWLEKIHKAEIGITSAAVCLYTILGCPNEESLLFSDVKSWIPNVLTNVFDSCLIPIVEARADGNGSEFFKAAAGNKDHLKRLLENSKKLLDVLSTACAEVKGMDLSVNPIEFLCVKLIFVQNAALDKNSCLGIQVYEKVRKVAMSCLARLYARHPRERATILDEVLSSLDKLPSNSRSARQYKLGNGKNIQLITALFMQLVQTTALEMPEIGSKTKRTAPPTSTTDINHSDDDEDPAELQEEIEDETKLSPLFRLQGKAAKLFDTSARSAHEIIMYLVSRASKTTKTGDSPYRNVLDLFVEDLATVISDPEWPSSELMLRILAKKMINLANHDKSAATKNMALESLGTMGSAISAQKSLIPSLAAALEREGREQSDVSVQLCELARAQELGTLRPDDMIGINGPFAIVSRQLWSDAGQNLRVRSACGYFLAHYAKLVSRMPDTEHVEGGDTGAQSVRVANWLLDLIPHVGSESLRLNNFDAVDTDEAELGYALCILNVGFCSYFGEIVKTLASSFSSDQALVRSRSLKSVVSMLETDSSLLDRDQTIAEDIFRCASDESALVRDSALSLIARFIISKPALQQKGIKRLLECASDAKVGVQKRAISHLKEVYVADTREFLRSKISFTFLERTGDPEESVADLARKTLSDVWVNATIAKLNDAVESKARIAVESLSMDIVRCIAHQPVDMTPLLQKFLVSMLKGEPKTTGKVRELFTKVVDELFERTISGAEDQGPLHALAAFAAASPQLIKPERLSKLQSYLGHIKNDNDLFMFRSVIRIYSSVLPDLSATHKPLLAEIQVALMKAIPSLGRRTELDPLMSCLRTIDGVLKNTLKLVKFTASVFNGIKINRDVPPKLTRLLRMAGAIARHLDFEDYFKSFSQEIRDFRGKSVADYIAGTFNSLADPRSPFEIRVLALEALGSLCQASPVQFNNKSVRTTLFSSLGAKDAELKTTNQQSEQLQYYVLRAFDELYAQRAQAKAHMDGDDEAGEVQELGKMGGDSKTRDGDSAVVIITREVVNHVLEIALSSTGENALLASQILSSISHEGLIHPKQSTGAFVALGTSADAKIAKVAHLAHGILHQTHESVCEREYMHAVQQAFDYQMAVAHDATGGRPLTYQAKLADCFSIINTSNAKYVKKFLSGLVTRIANDVAGHEVNGHDLSHAMYARFILQNVAFFEYRKMDDLLHTILQLELAYSKSGGEVVQMLEQNMPPKMPAFGSDEASITDGVPHLNAIMDSTNMTVIKRLAPVAATLTMLIETRSYLVRQYAVGRDVRVAISNSKQAKDSGKAPAKVYGINGEKIWNKTNNVIDSLNDESSLLECCKQFISLMNTDDDIEVDHDALPQDTESNGPVHTNGENRGATPGNRKRKGSASVGNTPSKRQRHKSSKEFRRSASFSSGEEMDDDYQT